MAQRDAADAGITLLMQCLASLTGQGRCSQVQHECLLYEVVNRTKGAASMQC